MKGKKIWKKVLVLLLVLAVAGGVLLRVFFQPGGSALAASYSEVEVSRQDIAVTLSSTGTLQPANQYNVTASVQGEVLSCTFEEGDIVEEGAILYEIDKSDIENTIQRASLTLESSQESYQDALESLDNLNVTAQESGVVTQVYVEEGDEVQAGGSIAEVRNSAVMEITLPFNASDANTFYVGQSASLTVDGSFETLTGTVVEIAGAETVLDGYQIVKDVTIQVSNPGGLSDTTQATAVVGGAACNSSGTFTYSSEFTVQAEVSGKVESLSIRSGSSVQEGQVVAVLSSSSVEDQVESAQRSLEDTQLSYENTVEQLDDYTITAPISGTVITKNVKVGDSLDTTNGQSTLAVIYDLSYLTFDISLDELDISQVEVGQSVSITCDAISSGSFEGRVTKVSVAGTTQNGVTNYPVTVQIDDPPEGLLPGMNVDAVIIVSQSEQVLSVPSAALQRGNTVYVKDETATNDSGVIVGGVTLPDGWRAVQVETGLSDDNYVEITSGLSEGDIVFVPQTVRESSGGFSEMGGMGGAVNGGA